MECNFIHSGITTKLQGVGKGHAKRKGDNPYQVFDLQIQEILDYKLFMTENLPNGKKSDDLEEVRWQKMSLTRFEKSEQYKMKFRENIDELFKTLDFNKRSRRHTMLQLKQRHEQPILMNFLKCRDLLSLFSLKSRALGNQYRQFYVDLLHNGDVNEP